MFKKFFQNTILVLDLNIYSIIYSLLVCVLSKTTCVLIKLSEKPKFVYKKMVLDIIPFSQIGAAKETYCVPTRRPSVKAVRIIGRRDTVVNKHISYIITVGSKTQSTLKNKITK